ncbi:MAG: hypothetical protein U0744_19870 [Gemmataceae bacterium]
MDARRFCSLLLASHLASPLAHADAIPLAVERGQCTVTLRAEHADASWWLVLGNAAASGKSSTITIRCEPTREEPHLPRCDDIAPSSAWRAFRREQLTRWEQAARIEDDRTLTPREPERTRGFWMLKRDRDLDDPNSYVHAKSTLVAMGRECMVYLDDEEPNDERLRNLAQSIVRTFDEEVLPWMAKHLGRAMDIDRDGRFCIFLTPRVATMQGTAGSLQGFVRGSDFYRDLETPFGNRCDMMYVSSKAAAGATLKALLAHEYAHAIVFAERVLKPRLPNAERKDEESWLGEGLSHLIERAMVPDSPHLDHRLSAFLNDPARHRLIVSDYFSERLWRDPGTRGAVIAFLEWCHEREPDLIRRLGRTSHSGVANLEIAMQSPIEHLFREWSVAQIGESLNTPPSRTTVVSPFPSSERGGRGGESPHDATDTPNPASTQFIAPWTISPFAAMSAAKYIARSSPVSVVEKGAPSRFVFAGPRYTELDLAVAGQSLELASTGVSYLRLHAARAGSFRITINASSHGAMQVTLAPIPANTPRYSLTSRREDDRLSLTHSGIGSDATLIHGAIEFSRPGPRLYAETPIRRISPSEWQASTLQLDLARSWRNEELIVKTIALDRRQRVSVSWIVIQP